MQVQILIVLLNHGFQAFPRKNMDSYSILLEVPMLLMDDRAFLSVVLKDLLLLPDIKAYQLRAAKVDLLPAGVL
jgi:hypothetical protein